MKRVVYKLVSALFLASILSWLYLVMPSSFFSLNGRLHDFMFLIRKEIPTTNNIVIIDIDEKSLKKYGQWPWSRNLISQLLINLTQAQADIIGLDIVFAEEDKTSPDKYAKYCLVAKKLPNYDEILANTFANTPVIGGYIFSFDPSIEAIDGPNIPAVFVKKGFAKKDYILKPSSVILNIEKLQNALYSSGFFNNTPDEGGTIRSVPLIMEYKGVIYPSLALEMFRIYQQKNRVDIVGDSSGVEFIRIGNLKIPTDISGRLVVNYRGPQKTFQYISAADVLENKFNVKDVAGKFVLVGTSAIGLADIRSIPYDTAIAGVEVHANILDNLLKKDFLHKPSEVILYDLVMIWLIIFVAMASFSLIGSRLMIPLTVLELYLLYKAFYIIEFQYGYVLNLLFPFISFVVAVIISIGIDYFLESKQEEKTKQLLGKKVSQKVMQYLIKHADDKLIQSKEVNATVFFSDIRSFTTISEKIGSPDKVIRLLNDYMTPMVENIIKYEGTIDKFIGDAIMAYWNAPIPVQNHQDKAVESAVEQIQLLKKINKKIQKKYGVSIKIGIGIHTGLVTAGDMGSEGRSDYTIIGDNVNLASRMEGLTKQYGVGILISKNVVEKLTKKFKIRPVDLVAVKGKSQAVAIYEVLVDNTISDAELELYDKALKKFNEANLEEALTLFMQLQEKNPAKLYEQYIDRINYYLENPNITFSPILKMTTK